MANKGISIKGHHAQRMTRSLIEEADLIFCMSSMHEKSIIDMVSTSREKIVILNIQDPIGLGDAVYEKCLESIIVALEGYMNLILKDM